jgi:hypothetical protein
VWKWEWFISGNAVVVGCFEGAELCQGVENRPFNIDNSGGERQDYREVTTAWKIKIKDYHEVATAWKVKD